MAAELKIGLGVDDSGLQQGLRDAEARVSQFVGRIEKLSQVGEQLTSIGQKMTIGITAPLVALGAGALKAYGDIESLKKGLEAVTGSASAANAEFIKLQEVAKLPGLGMEEAVKGSINLQAIGLSADYSRNILQQFGNAVATVGKGTAEFERAVYGVQQLANTDFPLGEDLNIIKDALPQVSNLLKDAFGTSRSDELAKMGVTSKQVLDTIMQGLEKLPRVSGGIKGAFENLGDSMKMSLSRIGDAINKNFDISAIIDKITGFVDKAVSAFENLNPGIQKAIIVVAGLAAAAGPLLIAVGGLLTMLPTLTAGIGAVSVAFTAMTGPIGLVVAGIAAIIAVVVSQWGKIKPYIEGTINWFIDLYNQSTIVRVAVQAIGLAFRTAFDGVGVVLSTVWSNIKTLGKGVLELFAGIGGVIKGALSFDGEQVALGYNRGLAAIVNTANGFAVNFGNAVKGFGDAWDKNIQRMANSSKVAHISLDDVAVSAEGLADKVEKVATKAVKNGVDKVKTKIAEIPAIDLTPIVGETAGFQNALGERFKAFEDYVAREEELHSRVNSNNLKLVDNMSQTNAAMAIRVQEFNNAVSQVMNQGVTDMIANGAMAFGDALAQGENALGAVGKSLLSTFGAILVQLGKMAIAEGVALIAIQTALKSLNPYVALAAGAALIALGSYVSSSVKGLGNSMGAGGGSSSGGSFSSSGGSSSATYSSTYGGGGGGLSGNVVFRISGNDLLGVLERTTDKNLRLNG